ncbi:EamA/RhaT family transporter [Paenibacillus peoriae]|uniref:DMT family transporter n=1 Tax=Paenibacillus peoriae TaxID=59893 RepID=UPI000CECB094|nr:DMT family transporter [Paenibacillus peoriae]PPQ46243.1 EamA/RhaT family transporter [Paenibacillus peoriae]
MNKPTFSTYMELVIATSIVGSSVVVGKLVVMRLPVFLSQSASLAVALLFLVPIVFIKKYSLRISKRDALILFIQALVGMFLFRVLMLYGLAYASASESGILTSLTPAIVALLSYVLLREKIALRSGLGIACSLLGVLALQVPHISAFWFNAPNATSFIGLLLVLSAVFGEAALTVLRKMLSSHVSSLLGTMYITLFSFFMFLAFSFVEAQQFNFNHVGVGEIGLVLYYGIFVTALGYVLWFRGVSRVPASTAAVYTGCIPVSTLLLSYIILRESFSFAHLAGAGFVFLGIILMSRGERR